MKLFYLLILVSILIVFFSYILLFKNQYECYQQNDNFNKIKVYCINRISRPDRLKRFYERIKKSLFSDYLDIQIIRAVDKDNLDLELIKSPLPPGATGCYYSHIKILLEFLSTDKEIKYCLIFEDDAVCKDDLLPVIKNYVEGQTEYDLLILGDNYRQGEIECVDDAKLKIEICYKFNMVFGAHAYFVNKRAANILLSQAFPIKNPYDLYYSDPEVYKDLRVGLTNYKICNPEDLNDSNTTT